MEGDARALFDGGSFSFPVLDDNILAATIPLSLVVRPKASVPSFAGMAFSSFSSDSTETGRNTVDTWLVNLGICDAGT